MKDDLMLIIRENERDNLPPSRLINEVQIVELRRRFKEYHHPDATLKPGDLVREKEGLGILKPELRDTRPAILWRMLDKNSVLDDALIRRFINEGVLPVSFNCLVAMISDRGTLEFHWADLATLERWKE